MAKQQEAKAKPGFFKRLGNYLASSYSELKKVIWPTRKELINHTWIVIVICAIFVVITLSFDTVFSLIFDYFTGR